ncbi:MAG: 4Fe-4S binding protein [Melioribacteraceae bacterium]|nr:4Fe-4S binding protein [Melioribacteraceae bacterium]
MLRKIIEINEDKCTGCGECVPECHEGALQVIDGKVRLISDLFCDGLGACIGYCPEGALTVIEREAEPYNETKVMDYIVKGGENVIKAHLKHLAEHGEFAFLAEAKEYLTAMGMAIPFYEIAEKEKHGCGEQNISISGKDLHAKDECGKVGCGEEQMTINKRSEVGNNGSGANDIDRSGNGGDRITAESGKITAGDSNFDNENNGDNKNVGGNEHKNNTPIRIDTELTHWPIQLHLINPSAGHFRDADLLLAADCSGFSYPNFHTDFLKEKTLAIACPKLDTNKQVYLDKLIAMIDSSNIKSITVLVMQVPCCNGLVKLAQQAVEFANREIPVRVIVIGIDGGILNDIMLN